tara:strand:+ start:1181 stop:1954 length:774 start_codon:yes stop_codon:yes gene_type:complete
MTRKNHVILDLDLTLIHTKPHNFNIPEEVVFNKSQQPSKISYIPAPIFNSKIYIRPHIIVFLEHIFKNYDVSIWTAGELRYCHFILNNLLPKSYIRKLKWVVARNKNIYNAVSGHLFIKSGFSNSDIKIPYSKITHNLSTRVFKSVEHFANILGENISRLILLDDNVGNVYNHENRRNVYLIPEFHPSKFKLDNELIKFTNWLKQQPNHKNHKNPKNQKIQKHKMLVRTRRRQRIPNKKLVRLSAKNGKFIIYSRKI